VPENHVAYVRRDQLVVGDGAKFTPLGGKPRAMRLTDVDALLERADRERDGSYRIVASKGLPGKPIGRVRFYDTRPDDPNDIVPHEHRRELRGYGVFAAWLNHVDAKAINSLDMLMTENGRSFVRHNLIDFSAILGAGRNGPRAYPTGSEYYVDYRVMGREAVTLGSTPFAWEASADPHMPSVGFVEAKTFDPARWRPDYPNPAFDERTARDIRWGARIVGAFTNQQIRAAVDAAHYSDPRAADYVTRVLIERRDKIVRRWLVPVAPPMRAAR